MRLAFEALRDAPQPTVRAEIRCGAYAEHTAGLADGFLQANLVIVEDDYALDFMRFCQRNPKPCPVVGVSDTGNPMMTTLGRDIDIRTDVPSYNIYRDGVLTENCSDITALWQDNMVAFALGCSFTFEHAIMRAGFPLWHIDNDRTVPMFKTTIPTVPAGPFGGPMVVSMRAIAKDRLDEVKAISAQFPLAHGAPVHWGDPAAIGIDDIAAPDWGDATPVGTDEVAVFWACGVTPQAAIMRAGLPICITHKPGQMLITDISDTAETPIHAAE
jgi:uncharacterized protein YcsI (UPF0317 family)